ncbi:MBL fold metallo-hydrolase [Thiomicrorhabdus xiamenensis]|uniref:MBL fold metallo-hydrolase n=1 Tax=Thiomicrorhabdus xiamenensis TaxID=2739063 RepID=A0A7D4NQ80_9GAMM|nr:MBL fold metallo-hydrolase [Thiomicrorhabdus xiamenensis]QKI88612.1 MBL fold metallo-hydrolase [Thiomicrorhabdus xiamenensis]
MKKLCTRILALSLAPLVLAGCANREVNPRFSASFYQDGVFASAMDQQNLGFTETSKILWELFVQDTQGLEPENGQIPVHRLSREDLLAMPEGSVVRFVHSTLLFRLDNRFVLTDPVFSERTSPVPFFGPKRFHDLPITLDEMPFIDILILSHNHYDHLDEPTLRALKDRIGHVYTTLGIKSHLLNLGFDPSQVSELDWWEAAENDTLKITVAPAQHFSGRGLFDRNKTLWASWVIKSAQYNLYFGADSGYFDGFREIGERLGPFDMTFLENGAYNQRWRKIHMMPEETVQAHLDLGGKWLFPIHNGSFKLSMHPWKEPFERISKAAAGKGVKATFPIMGEVTSLQNPAGQSAWWQQ